MRLTATRGVTLCHLDDHERVVVKPIQESGSHKTEEGKAWLGFIRFSARNTHHSKS